MIHPLRENLEIHTDGSEAQIRCAKCSFVLARSDGDWRKASKRKLLPPTKAGPLMDELVGQYLLEQLYCPTCGALFDTRVVEAQREGGARN
jgi:Zn finger protein HypA/HybF involved in hydrogenase expression